MLSNNNFNAGPFNHVWVIKDRFILAYNGVAIGTPALSFIAVFGSCLTFPVKRASVLIPIIIMPLYIPTLVFGAKIINFSDNGNLYANTNLVVLGAITLISIAIVPSGHRLELGWH